LFVRTFFFSSRRRHTIFSRDWSSDVCSSDLPMANPDPEITPEEIYEVREDAIIATGRSDYPNQINNVLGFPYIFRGALDARARRSEERRVGKESGSGSAACQGKTITSSANMG